MNEIIEGPSTGAQPSAYLPTTPLTETLDTIGRDADSLSTKLEADRRIPQEILERLRGVGAFDQLMPTSLGVGVTPTEWFHNGLRCAWWNASFGWVVTQSPFASANTAILAPELSDRIRAAVPRPIQVGSNAGLLELVRSADGWLVNGTIRFVSGSHGSDYFVGLGCEVGVDATPATVRLVSAPTAAWEILDDWDTVGLRGTASNSIRATNLFCDELAVYSPAVPPPGTVDPMQVVVPAIGGAWGISMAVAATQLGTARRALDEAYVVAANKYPAPTFALLDSRSDIRRELMMLEGRWYQTVTAATRSMDELWATAMSGDLPSDRDRAMRATLARLSNETAAQIVSEVWAMVGTSALNPQHPIARCMRDVQPHLGHLAANPQVLDFAAMRWRGEDPGNPIV